MPTTQGYKLSLQVICIKQDMFDGLAGSGIRDKRFFNGRFNLLGIMVLIEHQHADKIFNAFRVPLLLDKKRQKPLQRLRPAAPPLPDRTRRMKGLWPLPDQLQIMFRLKAPLVVAEKPIMEADALAAVKNLHLIHMQHNAGRAISIDGGNRIPVLIHKNR